ncbi:hypothetical protein [Streptomyces sp. NPDC058330]|uniref:hypothetical protein n=1 Tax=Streptomyces sp. NPDC058330 TaxID=3346449 RepID=UPI0036ED10C0
MTDDEERSPANPCVQPDERVIGLIAEPGPAEDVAHDVADELPGFLSRCTDINGSPVHGGG